MNHAEYRIFRHFSQYFPTARLRLLGGAGAGAGPVTFDANLLGAAGGWENWTKASTMEV